MNRALMTLVLSAFAMSAHAALELRANEQPLPVTRDPQAIAKIPPGYRFVEPGTLTVAISALNSPPLALLASDNRTRIGSDPDIARLLAGSLGLKLRLVPTAWEDWPLGIAAGRYDVALINSARRLGSWVSSSVDECSSSATFAACSCCTRVSFST